MSLLLPQAFYARPARVVARELLGRRLLRLIDGIPVGGVIVETEAYCDSEEPDLACHGTRNKGRPTPRTEVMFGPGGHAYIYFTYGMHWMFNIVTGREGQANAVLVRALEPDTGEDIIASRRPGRTRREWTSGPGRLALALDIDRDMNGAHLFRPDGVIWIEDAPDPPPEQIATGPRIGLGRTPEPWYSAPWRYWIAGNPFVSR